MKENKQLLIEAAQKALQSAYAPYSNFKVGAAIQTLQGVIYTGANVENASYGLCICAERNAIIQAVLQGEKQLTSMAVVSQGIQPALPCGMCLQVLAEFTQDCVIICSNGTQEYTTTLMQLLPMRFGPTNLTNIQP